MMSKFNPPDKFLNALVAPEGFTKTVGVDKGWNGQSDIPEAVFKGHDGQTTIKVQIYDPRGDWSVGSGHTNFTTARGSFSFDRRGVEDSFYVNPKDTVEVINQRLVEQVAKVVAARARHATSVTVPFVGHVITLEQKAEITATLAAGKTYTFTPSGFGTGYQVFKPTPKTRKDAWTRRVPEAMEAFFGITGLWYNTMDCD